MATPSPAPNPGAILDTLRAYQQAQALKAAIELEFFTHIADGAATAAEIASKAQASERGTRILCDFLVVYGYLTKSSGRYGLSQDSAVFLNKRSPAYLGSLANFLVSDTLVANFNNLAAAVRKGGTLNAHMLDPEDPAWVEFARSMAPMMAIPSDLAARAVARPGESQKVLDIAAGHGFYGLAVARHNPAAEIYAVDWANVLEVAKENAAKMGASNRYHTIPGSAFDVDLGSGYDLILLPNFLHHFDPSTNVKLLQKVHAALKAGGMLATVEFVPNEDRVSPPLAATFAIQMLGGTPAGDAYTFQELDAMFREAGFGASELQSLDPAPASLIVTARP